MLFKSNSTKNVEFSGFSQGVDYLPTLLNLAGIKYNDSFDGMDITKVNPKYSLSELIYNNDYYRAVIFDEMHMFSCTSKNKIKTQNDIDYDDCIYKLQRIDSMSNVDQNDDIVIKKYKNILKSH
jgi:arylsulfatase A-like enzyme